MANASDVSYKQYWWRSSDYEYVNKDIGNMADKALAGDNWFVHALPGTIAGVIALIFVVVTYYGLLQYKTQIENKEMLKLGNIIMNGAKDFLKAEYYWLLIFVVFVFTALSIILIGSKNSDGETVDAFGVYTALPLLLGAALSSGAGWLGMVVATMSNVITVHASNVSINEGLKQAFKSGSIMGFSVTGLGIFGLSIMYFIYRATTGNEEDTWQYLSGFGFGASCIALFARVGGGIYTKAADVGADLVGKVEADVPEDHPNNAAVIADNVGDNVGDVAGMGADLFESYVGSIIAACTLATQQFNQRTGTLDLQRSAIALPFWISGFGIVCSMLGTFLVTTDTEVVDPGEDAK